MGIIIIIIIFRLHATFFVNQLLRHHQADLPEIISHDTSTAGQGPVIFQILIRIMDHDPDHFKDFQKKLRISETI